MRSTRAETRFAVACLAVALSCGEGSMGDRRVPNAGGSGAVAGMSGGAGRSGAAGATGSGGAGASGGAAVGGSAGAGGQAGGSVGGTPGSGGAGGNAGSAGTGGGAGAVAGGVDVLTQHNDIARTGANLNETVLNTTNVASAAFGKVFARSVDDQIYTQPLVVSGLDVPGRGKRNVVYVATVNDSVYAFDADTAAESEPLWTRRLVPGSARPPRVTDIVNGPCRPYTDFSDNMGIVGTPVIDRAAGTLYVVARVIDNGAPVQRLHALNIVDGSERPNSPVVISASIPGTGEGRQGNNVVFDSLRQNQRPALLLLGGIVYIGWAGHCDTRPYHGWLIGYDAATLSQEIVYNTTPDGTAGGIWHSGQGPSSDGTNLYLATGNGTLGVTGDPRASRNRGLSFLKLERSGSTLNVLSWFTPYNHEFLEREDRDLGSAGLLLVPETRLVIAGGKGGWLYVVDRDDMGGLTQSLARDDNVVQTFSVNAPAHLHGSPIFWNSPNGGRVYIWAEEDYLKSYPFLGAAYEPGSMVLDVDNVQRSSVRAPIDPAEELSMPGAMLSLSANGSQAGTGIVWASVNYMGNANNLTQPGILRAFDAADITDELWNSRTNLARDDCGLFPKFSYPTIANGKVYLASFSDQLCVYGLTQ